MEFFFEDLDVKDFLGIAEPEMLEFGVETGFFGAEVWDAETGGNSRASQDDDVFRGLEERDNIVDGVVLREFEALRELARDAVPEKREVRFVGGAFEERGGTDVEGCDELLGRDDARADGLTDEGFFANGTHALPEGEGLFGGAGLDF